MRLYQFFRWCLLPLLLLLLVALLSPAGAIATPLPSSTPPNPYQTRTPSRDGIGKVYMGREISDVLGHLGAGWLERPTRLLEEQPARAIAALHLAPTDTIADIGAGTGYFSFRLAAAVPQGRVLAVDSQPEMVEILEGQKAEYRAQQGGNPMGTFRGDNVQPILGTEDSPQLPPASVDVALLVDAYHEFSQPREMMQGIIQALKPGGRVVLIEYRGENPLIPIKPHHKMTQAQVKKELTALGLVWQETLEVLPQQHILIFST
jgi:SAM-dependent methyltransferase